MAHLIRAGMHTINLDNVAYIETGAEPGVYSATVYFLGVIAPLRLDGQDAKNLLISLGAIKSESVGGEEASDRLPARKRVHAVLGSGRPSNPQKTD